jgi:chorismate mutase
MFNHFNPSLKNIAQPLLIAGPCSAESHEQLLGIAQELKSAGVHIMRAGAWKPRTRPGAFEGYGKDALKWMKSVSAAIGLPFITEVACPQHVEDALEAGIQFLWIGARTTVNPFLVQQIADALKGVDIPVMVKNPVNPDVNLWRGGIERLMHAGIDKVAAIHRGFSSYENSVYRNKPNWEIAIELRRLMPDLPLICDPSHICGNTSMIREIAQLALDLQYNGLMIEVHNNPSAAMSDAKQQLTPIQFKEVLASLIVRYASPQDAFERGQLQDLRDRIDEIDDDIIQKIAERMWVARSIGKYKDLNNIAILQPDRFREILDTRTKKGLDNKLTKEFILRLYSLIHEESIFQQGTQMSKTIKSLP